MREFTREGICDAVAESSGVNSALLGDLSFRVPLRRKSDCLKTSDFCFHQEVYEVLGVIVKFDVISSE